ncbi:MAG: hypothetical protein P0Y53_01355 [Candidatus Pseudobacter hemicellulosilyticus]|uniref:Uncharacterized protein n=1 Tax=Candidatus Pseudobacter hemicellulosilyticus TaxID=3121375 RepID=A0AAJ5WU04_9BACT|nr:MAG: hypothetical protein P0Y53_01355 [Pseudobacter sp.]
MFKQKSIIIISMLALAALFLTTLFWGAKLPNTYKNGFTRIFSSKPITEINRTQSKEPFLNISGVNNGQIHLTVPNPNWVISIDTSFKKIDTVYIGIPQENGKEVKTFTTYVDSTSVKVLANNISTLFYGTINKPTLQQVKLETLPFTRSTITNNAIIVRAVDSTYRNQVFHKIDLKSGRLIQTENIFKMKDDGGLDSDGILTYDQFSHNIVYIKNYENKFYLIDTNLNILSTHTTIDTTSAVEKFGKIIKSKNNQIDIKPSTSRVIVNNKCSIYKNILYILSGLKADNENNHQFKNNSVVDKYSLPDGQYIESFYIPNIQNQKLKDFYVGQEKIFALYKDQIAIYKLK